jgi:hypothetical protein
MSVASTAALEEMVSILADRLAIAAAIFDDLEFEIFMGSGAEAAQEFARYKELIVGPTRDDLDFKRDKWRKTLDYEPIKTGLRSMLREQLKSNRRAA